MSARKRRWTLDSAAARAVQVTMASRELGVGPCSMDVRNTKAGVVASVSFGDEVLWCTAKDGDAFSAERHDEELFLHPGLAVAVRR